MRTTVVNVAGIALGLFGVACGVIVDSAGVAALGGAIVGVNAASISVVRRLEQHVIELEALAEQLGQRAHDSGRRRP